MKTFALRKIMNTAAVLLLSMLALQSCSKPHTRHGVDFFTGTWEEAVEKARSSGKHIYIDAYTKWCGPCKEMERDVYTESAVADYMNRHFVCMKLDAEEGEGLRMAMKYRVRVFPTHLIFNSDGDLRFRATSGMPAERFLDLLKSGMKPENQVSLKGISRSWDLDYPDFCRGYLETHMRPSSEQVSAYLAAQPDWFDEATWSVIFWFGRGDSVIRFVRQNREKLAGYFGEDDVAEIIQMLISDEIHRSIQEKNPARRDSAIAWFERESDDHFTEWHVWNYRYDYAVQTQDWDEVIRMLQAQMDDPRQSFSEGTYNNVAWKMYRECDSPKHLAWAADLMKKVTDQKPVWEFVDTYAALLFKTGKLKEAEKQALRAIELGSRAGANIDSTRALLTRIREKMRN